MCYFPAFLHENRSSMQTGICLCFLAVPRSQLDGWHPRAPQASAAGTDGWLWPLFRRNSMPVTCFPLDLSSSFSRLISLARKKALINKLDPKLSSPSQSLGCKTRGGIWGCTADRWKPPTAAELHFGGKRRNHPASASHTSCLEQPKPLLGEPNTRKRTKRMKRLLFSKKCGSY